MDEKTSTGLIAALLVTAVAGTLAAVVLIVSSHNKPPATARQVAQASTQPGRVAPAPQREAPVPAARPGQRSAAEMPASRPAPTPATVTFPEPLPPLRQGVASVPATNRPLETEDDEQPGRRPRFATQPAPEAPVSTGRRVGARPEIVEPPTPVPGTLLREVVVGYETRKLNGFTMLLSTQAIREGEKQRGKPFQALVSEFDGLVQVLPASTLKPLQQVLIWIEWDNIDPSNPRVLAKYYGGRIWRLDGSAHPLKSNAIEVLSLKRLAHQKSLSVERPELVLLHELAHAVHHVVLDFENPHVIFAYNQAMDRRLYDRVQTEHGGVAKAYAATNEAEYFAELTCAYLDRCHYYPFTREDLRDHDPTGYRLMEAVWGNAIRYSEYLKQLQARQQQKKK